MNGCCKEVIEPSLKLGRMLSLLKCLVFIHFFLVFSDLFIFESGYFFIMSAQILLIFTGLSSKHFSHYLLSILLCIFNLFLVFQNLGRWAQVGFYKNDNSLTFCFFVFLLVFEIFCIFFFFQLYKQSKHEYRIKYGYAEGENGGDGNNENIQDLNDNLNENNNNNNINNDNNAEFIPFQGQGIAVGGN